MNETTMTKNRSNTLTHDTCFIMNLTTFNINIRQQSRKSTHTSNYCNIFNRHYCTKNNRGASTTNKMSFICHNFVLQKFSLNTFCNYNNKSILLCQEKIRNCLIIKQFL